MEDTFKVRIDKTFGSLSLSPSQLPSLNSLWCLTDEELEHHKWIPKDTKKHTDTDEQIYRMKNPKPVSPFLQGIIDQTPSSSIHDLQDDIQELDGDGDSEDDRDDDNGERELVKPNDHNGEEWDIRTSVGMDCTLDNEEEEDGYDKVAVGKEESAERFYMKDVNEYEADTDFNNELPNSFTDVTRDPRANHKAAKLRLTEDDESVKKLNLHEYNPPGYTHYIFDNSDDEVDEESNRKAYMDFLNNRKGSAAMEIQDDVSTDPLKSITFTPKKKSSDILMKKAMADGSEENMHKKVISISIEDSEVCMMDEDESVTNKGSSLQKSARIYRTKTSADLE